MGVIADFRDYVAESHAVDLSIGVVIGSALGTFGASFVVDIVAPLVGRAVGNVDFLSLAIPMNAPTTPTVNLGRFFGHTLTFITICLLMSLVLKFVNTSRKERQKQRFVAVQAPTTSEKILLEIRDALKQTFAREASRPTDRADANPPTHVGQS